LQPTTPSRQLKKIIKSEIYKANPDINPRKMYTHKIYDLCAIAKANHIHVPKGIEEKAGFLDPTFFPNLRKAIPHF